MKDFFDRVFVVNLDRRADRWKEFQDGLPKDWPFVEPERFQAIDGQKTGFPTWWTAGKGAWGCYRSHMRIMEMQLVNDWARVLYLEDDATFSDTFSSTAPPYLQSLPAGWHQAYLGGQLLKQGMKKTKQVANGVKTPFNVNRTHAFALTLEGARRMYVWLMDLKSWEKHPNHHIDHRMGILHESGKISVYVPDTWMVGQKEGKSNILGKEVPTRFWDGKDKKTRPTHQPMDLTAVAVIGMFRGGTSCVAGMLHHMGVRMGTRFIKANKGNPNGYWEAVNLQRLMKNAFQDKTQLNMPRARFVSRLAEWVNNQRKEACTSGQLFVGGKHPSMCMCGPELLEAWGPKLKIINVTRPLNESVQSMLRRGWWGGNEEKIRAYMLEMDAKRNSFLKSQPHLTVGFTRLLKDPEAVAAEMIEHLGLDPETDTRGAVLTVQRRQEADAVCEAA